MRLNEVTFSNAVPIDGYGPGFFRVGGNVYEGTVLTGPDGLVEWQGLDDDAPLLALAGKIDVLLIGTGAEISQISSVLRGKLEGLHIGAEVMNSPAACRTYNVLLAEGRRIALALLPV